VLARLLGRKATGLGSLLASELGVEVSKDLQQHDWSRRPLTEPQLSYLAGDVRYLVALYDKLSAEARAKGIEEEVAEESRFKLETALAPARERGPSYLRIKGADKLDPLGLAVLRRLVDTRERLAADWDVPPFKVGGNDLLLDLSRGRPTDREGLRAFRRGFSSRLSGSSDRLLAAIAQGIADGTVPPEDRAEPPRLDRAVAAERRAREKRLTTFRRAEALLRGVDEQVVLPGHCLQELVAIDVPTRSAMSTVKGLGAKRLELYADGLLRAMLTEAPSAPPPCGDEQAP
jgi:ribonuclease D